MHPLSEGTITQTLELLHSGSADARGTVTYQGNFALRCAPKHIAREAGGFLSTTEAAIETSHHVRTAFPNPTRRNLAVARFLKRDRVHSALALPHPTSRWHMSSTLH